MLALPQAFVQSKPRTTSIGGKTEVEDTGKVSDGRVTVTDAQRF
jgi:hypothetical protein